MTQSSILIVGAGPTGLAMACSLGRQGVQARIIDSAKDRANQSRALAIQARTMEVFDLWGLADEFLQRGLQLHGVKIHGEDKEPIFVLNFNDLPSRYPFILALPQSDTEEILINKAQSMGFNIERETRLTSARFDSDGCFVKLEKASGEEESAKFEWVIACDGSHSVLRELSHTEFTGKDYPEQFVLADVKIDWAVTPNEAQLFSSHNGLLACFPLPGGNYRLIANKDTIDREGDPDLEEIQRTFAARGPANATIHDMTWSSNFFIHARLVKSLQHGRMLLVGDAAHVHSPALGQGMNTGIQDADNLAWKLALVAKGRAGSGILKSYDAERWPVERGVLTETDFATRVMNGPNRLVHWLRDHLAPLILSNQRVASHVRALVSELAVSYSDSPIVCNNKGDWKLKAGDRAPDAALEMNDGETRLYNLLRPGGHYLLLLWEKEVELRALDLFEGEVTVLNIRRQPRDVVDTILDRRGEMTDAYGYDCAYLIRPDGYVGAVCSIDDVQATLRDYFPGIQAIHPSMVTNASLI